LDLKYWIICQKNNFHFNVKLGANTNLKEEPLLLKPNTYMNLSGKAVQYWMDENISLENIFVIDDLNLSFGTIRIRPKKAMEYNS
jgi:PTH1 family peptidyl-tRNA hydrolase